VKPYLTRALCDLSDRNAKLGVDDAVIMLSMAILVTVPLAYQTFKKAKANAEEEKA
jgi:hypothetical protein